MNLIFLHGTGMNKAIWHYHIDQLYERCWLFGVHINVVLAVDAVNHGTSALLNKGKLGDVVDWRDFSLDVAEVARAEKDVFFAGNKNILVGHSMAGFVSLYLTFLHPALFDSCVVLNPVCYASSNKSESPYEPFLTWERKKYMETTFSLDPGADWKHHVLEYMNTRSFYRNFDPKVLANMLEDEYPPNPLNGTTVIDLNTTKKQTLITYLGGYDAMVQTLAVFSGIRVPVYRILGELDTAADEVRNRLQEAIPAMKTTVLPGQKHLVHGLHPDLFVDTLVEILKERVSAVPPKFARLELALKLKL